MTQEKCNTIGLWSAWSILSTLMAFAFVQPIFDALGNNPTFFFVRQFSQGELIGFACTLMLAPAMCSLLVLSVCGRWLRMRQYVFCLLSGIALLALMLPIVKQWEASAHVVFVVSAVCAFLLTMVVWQSKRVRAWFHVLVWAQIMFPVWFLVSSPAASAFSETNAVSVALPTTHESKPPVVVLLFDQLPVVSLLNDRAEINHSLFPNFAQFARTSTWYRNASAAADFTSHAVPAILTGRYMRGESAPNQYRSDVRTLFSEAAPWYTMYAAESHTNLCPAVWCETLRGQRATHLFQRLADDVVDATMIWLHTVLPLEYAAWAQLPHLEMTWLDTERLPSWKRVVRHHEALLHKLDQNELVYLHIPIPHHPFHLAPNGVHYPPLDGYPEGMLGRSMDGIVVPEDRAKSWEEWAHDWDAKQGLQRQLLQTTYADQILGNLLYSVSRSPQFEQSLIVVLSDHGMRFRARRDARALGGAAQPDDVEITHVPLFIKYPGQSLGTIVDDPVSVIDVLPTIMEQAKIPTELAFDGQSLHAPARQSERWAVRVKDRAALHPVIGDVSDLRTAAVRWSGMFAHALAAPHALYQLERIPGMFGRSVHSMPIETLASPWSATLYVASAQLLANAQPENGGKSKAIAVRMKGQLTVPAGTKLPMNVAVANHGHVIGTSAVTHVVNNQHIFSLIVPPESLAPFGNKLTVYLVTDDSPQQLRVPLQSIEVAKRSR